jgi:hypothetical protein
MKLIVSSENILSMKYQSRFMLSNNGSEVLLCELLLGVNTQFLK